MEGRDPGQFVELQAVPLIGGRRFWVYSGDPPPGQSRGDEVFNASFDQLDTRYQADRSGPIGVCVPVSDPEAMRRRREAVWPGTELMYAGTQEDGTQLRIRYFYDATVGPGYPNSPSIAESEAQDYPLPPGYRIEPLQDTDAATPDDVIERGGTSTARSGSTRTSISSARTGEEITWWSTTSPAPPAPRPRSRNERKTVLVRSQRGVSRQRHGALLGEPDSYIR